MADTLAKIWALFTPAEQRKAVLVLILISIMALAETAGVLSIAPFLSVLVRPSIVHENRWLSGSYKYFEFSNEASFIQVLGLITMAIVISSSVFKTLTFHYAGRFVHMQRQSLSVRLLSIYLQQPYEFFLARNSSELTKNVLSEVDQIIFDVIQPMFMIVAHGMVSITMILLVLFYDPWLAVCIVVAISFLYSTIYALVRRRLKHIGTERQQADADRYRSCTEVFGGIKDVKITHAIDVYLQNFSRAAREFSRHSATAETLSQSPLYIVEAVGYTGLITIALFLLWRTGDVAHVLPALGLYGFAAYRLLPAMQVMYRGLARLRFSSLALEHIYADLLLPTARILPASNEVLAPKNEIRLQGICFAYPAASDKLVLKDFNLTIKPNTSTGIVGKSGSGKSTLMDILLGLLTPQEGALIVDGTPITSKNLSAWQRAIGYVPQHIYIADASVAENIAFGLKGSAIDMKAVQRAASAAQIHDMIVNELAAGYKTELGERGTRLSGGQRQRIGIARALYRDPPILFFDEATSALDSTTEDSLNAAIHQLSGKKTIIIIAHKVSALRSCHRVVEIEQDTPRNASNTLPI